MNASGNAYFVMRPQSLVCHSTCVRTCCVAAVKFVCVWLKVELRKNAPFLTPTLREAYFKVRIRDEITGAFWNPTRFLMR